MDGCRHFNVTKTHVATSVTPYCPDCGEFVVIGCTRCNYVQSKFNKFCIGCGHHLGHHIKPVK